DAMARQSETVNLVTGRRGPSNLEHRLIVEAIASGDGDAAGAAMGEHLSKVQQAVSLIVRSTP
ncbi:FCD domain-containing protein, partial [Salmonella enterica]|nr:FCD domain-containing protein [Salmonella enterica]